MASSSSQVCCTSDFADKVVHLCLNHFNSFTNKKHGKPEANRQWTVLACFVKEQGMLCDVRYLFKLDDMDLLHLSQH